MRILRSSEIFKGDAIKRYFKGCESVTLRGVKVTCKGYETKRKFTKDEKNQVYSTFH